MNSFADKKQKPTTDEYLEVGLNQVLDRLNKNPNGSQSEAEFVNAVITVRNAMITEKLNRRLVYLTGAAAIATVLLVIIPFIIPSLEYQRLESKIVNAQTAYNGLQAENRTLNREIQELKQTLSVLNKQIQNTTPRSDEAMQKRADP